MKNSTWKSVYVLLYSAKPQALVNNLKMKTKFVGINKKFQSSKNEVCVLSEWK